MAVNAVNAEFHGEAAQYPVFYLVLKGNAGPSFLKGLQMLNGVNGKPLFHGAFLQQQGHEGGGAVLFPEGLFQYFRDGGLKGSCVHAVFQDGVFPAEAFQHVVQHGAQFIGGHIFFVRQEFFLIHVQSLLRPETHGAGQEPFEDGGGEGLPSFLPRVFVAGRHRADVRSGLPAFLGLEVPVSALVGQGRGRIADFLEKQFYAARQLRLRAAHEQGGWGQRIIPAAGPGEKDGEAAFPFAGMEQGGQQKTVPGFFPVKGINAQGFPQFLRHKLVGNASFRYGPFV